MIQSHELMAGGEYPNAPYSAGPSVPTSSTGTTTNGGTYTNGNGGSSIPAPVPMFPFGSYPYHPALAHPSIHSNPQLYYSLFARQAAISANTSTTSSPTQSPIPQPPMSAPASMKEVPLKHWPIVPGFTTDLSSTYPYGASGALSALFHSHQQQQASQLAHSSSSDETFYPFHLPNSQQASQILNNNLNNNNQHSSGDSQQPQHSLPGFKNKHQAQYSAPQQQVQHHMRRDGPRTILSESQGNRDHENQSARNVRNRSHYLEYYYKGSMIQLADGSLRRVEDMKTQDFISCVQATPEAELHRSKILAIETRDNNNAVLISFEVERDGKPFVVECPFEHPFFVYDKGWSACCPDRCRQIYGLDVRKLLVGDDCISLNSI